MRMWGVSANTSELIVEADGPLVKITAGFGHESGSTHLTPDQAEHAAEMIMLAAAEARKQDGWET